MTIETDHEVIQAPRIPTTAYLLVGIVVFLLIVLMGGGIIYVNDQRDRDNTAQDVRERQVCIAELNSDVLIAFGDAFGTSPAPGNDRAQAVKRIHVKAELLKHADDICNPGFDRAVYQRLEAKIQSSG